jgi:hypothetical protein
MGAAGVGWIAAIIVGGIAGWLAEQFMKLFKATGALRHMEADPAQFGEALLS